MFYACDGTSHVSDIEQTLSKYKLLSINNKTLFVKISCTEGSWNNLLQNHCSDIYSSKVM